MSLHLENKSKTYKSKTYSIEDYGKEFNLLDRLGDISDDARDKDLKTSKRYSDSSFKNKTEFSKFTNGTLFSRHEEKDFSKKMSAMHDDFKENFRFTKFQNFLGFLYYKFFAKTEQPFVYNSNEYTFYALAKIAPYTKNYKIYKEYKEYNEKRKNLVSNISELKKNKKSFFETASSIKKQNLFRDLAENIGVKRAVGEMIKNYQSIEDMKYPILKNDVTYNSLCEILKYIPDDMFLEFIHAFPKSSIINDLLALKVNLDLEKFSKFSETDNAAKATFIKDMYKNLGKDYTRYFIAIALFNRGSSTQECYYNFSDTKEFLKIDYTSNDAKICPSDNFDVFEPFDEFFQRAIANCHYMDKEAYDKSISQFSYILSHCTPEERYDIKNLLPNESANEFDRKSEDFLRHIFCRCFGFSTGGGGYQKLLLEFSKELKKVKKSDPIRYYGIIKKSFWLDEAKNFSTPGEIALFRQMSLPQFAIDDITALENPSELKGLAGYLKDEIMLYKKLTEAKDEETLNVVMYDLRKARLETELHLKIRRDYLLSERGKTALEDAFSMASYYLDENMSQKNKRNRKLLTHYKQLRLPELSNNIKRAFGVSRTEGTWSLLGNKAKKSDSDSLPLNKEERSRLEKLKNLNQGTPAYDALIPLILQDFGSKKPVLTSSDLYQIMCHLQKAQPETYKNFLTSFSKQDCLYIFDRLPNSQRAEFLDLLPLEKCAFVLLSDMTRFEPRLPASEALKTLNKMPRGRQRVLDTLLSDLSFFELYNFFNRLEEKSDQLRFLSILPQKGQMEILNAIKEEKAIEFFLELKNTKDQVLFLKLLTKTNLPIFYIIEKVNDRKEGWFDALIKDLTDKNTDKNIINTFKIFLLHNSKAFPFVFSCSSLLKLMKEDETKIAFLKKFQDYVRLFLSFGESNPRFHQFSTNKVRREFVETLSERHWCNIFAQLKTQKDVLYWIKGFILPFKNKQQGVEALKQIPKGALHILFSKLGKIGVYMLSKTVFHTQEDRKFFEDHFPEKLQKDAFALDALFNTESFYAEAGNLDRIDSFFIKLKNNLTEDERRNYDLENELALVA